MRPLSPETRLICLSRIEEKNDLVELNDRLTGILARNQNLEAANALLARKVTTKYNLCF
jgi:hypothetical protein